MLNWCKLLTVYYNIAYTVETLYIFFIYKYNLKNKTVKKYVIADYNTSTRYRLNKDNMRPLEKSDSMKYENIRIFSFRFGRTYNYYFFFGLFTVIPTDVA